MPFSCLHVLPDRPTRRSKSRGWDEKIKHLLIACLLTNVSANNRCMHGIVKCETFLSHIAATQLAMF